MLYKEVIPITETVVKTENQEFFYEEVIPITLIWVDMQGEVISSTNSFNWRYNCHTSFTKGFKIFLPINTGSNLKRHQFWVALPVNLSEVGLSAHGLFCASDPLKAKFVKALFKLLCKILSMKNVFSEIFLFC